MLTNELAKDNESRNWKPDDITCHTNLFDVHRVIAFPVRGLIAVAHVRDVAEAATLLVTE